MEIFISSAKQITDTRLHLRNAVLSVWQDTTGWVRTAWMGFAERWKWAEQHSTPRTYGGQPVVYCLADDDCLPCPDLDLAKIESLFTTHIGYGIIALADVHGNTRRDEVKESTCVGGIRFIRKGIVTQFPDTFQGCDSEYYDLMRATGYKSGVYLGYDRLHLGHYHSLWQRRNDPCPSK